MKMKSIGRYFFIHSLVPLFHFFINLASASSSSSSLLPPLPPASSSSATNGQLNSFLILVSFFAFSIFYPPLSLFLFLDFLPSSQFCILREKTFFFPCNQKVNEMGAREVKKTSMLYSRDDSEEEGIAFFFSSTYLPLSTCSTTTFFSHSLLSFLTLLFLSFSLPLYIAYKLLSLFFFLL